MASIETIRRIRVQQISEGADAVRRDLRGLVEGQEQAAAAAGSLAVATEVASRRQLSAASAFDRVRRSVDDSFKAQQALERGMATLDRAFQQGATDAATYERTMALLQSRYAGAAAEAQRFEAAQRAAAKATIEARQAQEVAAQAFQRGLNNRLGVGGGGGGDDRAADFEAAAAAGDKLRAKYDQVFAAAQRYAAVVDELTAAEKAGILTEEIAIEARRKATLSYNDQISAIENLARVQKEAAQRSVNQQTIVPDRGGDIAAFAAEMNKLQAEFDPVFAATQSYEAYVARLTRALSVGAIEQGVFNDRLGEAKTTFDAQIDKLNGVVAVQEKAARSASELRQAWSDLSKMGSTQLGNVQASRALGSLSNSTGSVRDDAANAAVQQQVNAAAQRAAQETEVYAKSLDGLRAKYDPLYAAQKQFLAAQDEIEQANKLGALSDEQRISALDRANATYQNQRIEIDKATAANGRLGKSAGLNAYAWQNLGFQINDVITSLASGISPFQTIAQQGGQITQVLQSDQGGLIGGLNSVKNKILELLSPARLVFGGITAAIAGAAYATYSYSEGQRKLTQNLDGVGRGSGATVSGINRLAPDAAAAGKISTVSAREMAGEFAATGKIGTEMYAGLIASARDYATTTGQELPEASKALAEAFADPSKGADALNKQLGFLNDTQRESIQRLQAQGNTLGAQKALFDGYVTSLSKADERLSFFTKQWEAFKNTTSGEVDAIGKVIDRVITGGDLQTRLETAQKVLANSQSRQSFLPFGIGAGDTAKAQAEVTRLQGEVEKERRRSELAQQNRVSLRIGELVRGLNPASEAIKKIEDQAKDIADNFAKIKFDEQGNARNAMAGLLAQAKQLREDMAAGGSQYADAIRAAQFGQRTVGFSPTGLTAAQIDESAANKRLDALRNASINTDMGAFDKQIQSIETERKLLQSTAADTAKLTAANSGGAFSRAPAAIQNMILEASKRFGTDPAILAAIGEKENGFKLTGATKVLDKNGNPSTTAYGYGQITDPAEKDIRKLPGMQSFDKTDPAQAVMGTAAYFELRKKWVNGDLIKALDGYGTGPGYGTDVLRLAGQLGDPSNLAQAKEQDTNTRALRDQQQALDNVTKNYGQNGLALEANAEATRRYNALLDAGVPASDALAASIKGLATQTASAAQQIKLTQFAGDVGFDRQQLGRTSEEQSAYSRARSLVGDTGTPQAQYVIAQVQMNDALRQTKDLSKDAFGGIVTDLAHGTSLANSFASALSKIGDKLISFGADKLFSGLFGSNANGAGGFLSSVLGGGGTSANAPSPGSQGPTLETGGFLSTIGKIFGFANGGIMGPNGQIPLHTYSNGGVANSPQMAIFGEGRMNEAYVPLPDGKRIPVAMAGAANSNSPTRVDSRSYNLDLRGSTLTKEEVYPLLQRAIAANNSEQDRTAAERSEFARRAAF